MLAPAICRRCAANWVRRFPSALSKRRRRLNPASLQARTPRYSARSRPLGAAHRTSWRQEAIVTTRIPPMARLNSAGAGVVGAKDGGAGAHVEADGGIRAAHSGRCGARRSKCGALAAGCAIAAAARFSRLYAVTAQTSCLVLRDLYYRRGYGPPWAAGARVHVQYESTVARRRRWSWSSAVSLCRRWRVSKSGIQIAC